MLQRLSILDFHICIKPYNHYIYSVYIELDIESHLEMS